jgi:hypothetical protein
MRAKGHCWHIGLIAALLGAVPASAQTRDAPSAVIRVSCDRACLIGHVRAYLAALKANDASKLPLASEAQYTENDVVVPLGKGIWRTVRDVAPTGLEAADPQTGNVAWFGIVSEHGNRVFYAVRMHVKDNRIDEIETVITRRTKPAPFGTGEDLIHDPAFNGILPPERRRSRERLIAVAQSYFNTVELNDGTVFAPFTEDCARLENGMSTTSRPKEPSGIASSIVEGCEAQFRLGIYRINKRIRERRFPIVDVERGVVVAAGFFDHANMFDRYKLANGQEMKTALKWPNSLTLLEAFQISDGKIHRIEAVFTYAPYFMQSPWTKGRAHAEYGE